MLHRVAPGRASARTDRSDKRRTQSRPCLDDQLRAFWYFFLGVIVFGFYITNLFVGVMFEAFLSYKNMDSRGRLISQEERRWRDYEKRLCRVGRSWWRRSWSRGVLSWSPKSEGLRGC